MFSLSVAKSDNPVRPAMICALVIALNSTAVLASGQAKEKKAQSSPISAYKINTPKKTKKKVISPASAYKKNLPGFAEAEKALQFSIDKSMAGTMNAIQWTFGASEIGRPILSGNRYQLINLAVEKALKHQKRTVAANLGFQNVSSQNYNMMVKRASGDGQLRYGDVIALNLKPYGWIRHKNQGWGGGINLGDDDHNPHYIWQVVGGKKGTKIYSGMPIALHNLKPYKTEVIFCLRTSGIDLGWRGKSECGGTLAEVSGKLFGSNGALSGEGLTGKIAKDWKDKLCKAGVAAVSTAVVGTSGGVTAAGAAAATPAAVKKCNAL